MTSELGAAVLGAGGGLFVELVYTRQFLKENGHIPWSRKGKKRARVENGDVTVFEDISTYIFSVFIRVILGAGVAILLLWNGPLSRFAAATGGMAAYALIDQWAAGVALPDNRSPAKRAEDGGAS